MCFIVILKYVCLLLPISIYIQVLTIIIVDFFNCYFFCHNNLVFIKLHFCNYNIVTPSPPTLIYAKLEYAAYIML